jgi:Glycosyl hydrolase family 79 C-terminal beta domain
VPVAVGLAVVSTVALIGVPARTAASRPVARAQRGVRSSTLLAGHRTGVRRLAPPPARATVEVIGNGLHVPQSYLGLSTEYWALPMFETHGPLLQRVMSLLQVPGEGPLVLRIGGDSADRTFWEPSSTRMSSWAFRLTPRWLAQLSGLVRRTGARLIIDLNLVTGSPSAAARLAQAVQGGLPRGSIIGFEVGNEPDIYSRRDWLATIAGSRQSAKLLPTELTARTYDADFRAYAQALAQVAPGVPLLGPALANPAVNLRWISNLLAGPHAGLGTVSVHRYPLSGCAKAGSRKNPTIARVLSDRASTGVAQSIKAAIRVAHRAGLPVRVTELNSVDCGGRAGVSNTFATALWAPDALFELLRAGVDGVNVHVRADAINAAFALGARGLTARPLLYGLILFARTLGADARLVHLRVRAEGSSHLRVWAVTASGGALNVLLINEGSRPMTVELRAPARRSATIERLLAPAVTSTTGVTLDGQRLGADGRWQGQRTSESISPGRDGYELTIPRVSAALVGLHV